MAITAAETEAEITSDLHNEIVAALNGTVSPTGVGSPMKFVQHNDAASYGVTAGNIDSTNGLAFKAQYGPVAGPTTLFTVAKAGIDHAIKATYLTSGKAIESLAQALPYAYGGNEGAGGIGPGNDYAMIGVERGTTGAPDTSRLPMVFVHRRQLPPSTNGHLTVNYLFDAQVSGVVGTPDASNSFDLHSGVFSITDSGTGGAHASIALTGHAVGDVGGTGSTWGLITNGTQYGTGGTQAAEFDVINANRAVTTLVPSGVAGPYDVSAINGVPIKPMIGVNINSSVSGSGANIHAALVMGADGGATAHSGIFFRASSISSAGVGLDCVNLTGATGPFAMRIGNNGVIVGRRTDNTDQAILAFDTSNRAVLGGMVFADASGQQIRFFMGANGQLLNVQYLTELTTIAAAATTDTTITMPATAVILGVATRVTVVIPTAATFTVGDSGSASRFSTASVSTAAGTVDAGTKAGAYYNASTLAVRITPNLTPGAATGRVRVVVAYYTLTPPTS